MRNLRRQHPPDELTARTRRPPRHVRNLFALGAILAVATILRLVSLGAAGLNSDEAVYVGQAATLSGDGGMASNFSLFRAHPLLVQFLLSVVFRITHVNGTTARVVIAVVFGVGGVVAAYAFARHLYGSAIALITALFLAVIPYHVFVSRQVLLDAPLTLFATLAFLAAHRWRVTQRPMWLLAAGAATGAATLAKEVGFIIGAVLLVYFVATGALTRRAVSALCAYVAGLLLLISPFIASRLIRASNASTTVLWQFGRAPNHTADYFPRVLGEYVGIPLLALAAVGIVVMGLRRSHADWLVLSWLGVMGAFFQLWPTKLVSYLIVLTPPLAIASATGLERTAKALARILPPALAISTPGRIFATAVVPVLVVAQMSAASFALARDGPAGHGQLASFGVSVETFAGGREAAEWADARTPANAKFLTLGPSMGNIISFYSGRQFVALSVSPDPRHRNPAYVPVPNPDLALRTSAVDYMVWDSYSAKRSPFTANRLLRYVATYNAVPVYAVWGRDESHLLSGSAVPAGVEPRIVVYMATGASTALIVEPAAGQAG